MSVTNRRSVAIAFQIPALQKKLAVVVADVEVED
jgi:hypothetical protein